MGKKCGYWYEVLGMLDAWPSNMEEMFWEDPMGWIFNAEMSIVSMIPTVLFIMLFWFSLQSSNVKWSQLFLLFLLSFTIVEIMLKNSISQKRPLGACSKGYGMPSGHGSISVCIFLFVLYFVMSKEINKMYALISGIFVVNVCYSSLFLGYHTILQVVAGWEAGAMISLVYLACLHLYLGKKYSQS